MRKDLVEHPAKPIGDDLKDINGKIIGGAWLFANRSAERIDFDFGASGKEAEETEKSAQDKTGSE